MSDGENTLDQISPDAPASEEVETNSLPANATSNEVQDLDASIQEDEPETDYSEPDEEYEEYEDNGKKYKLPKELIPRLMKDADYTRKTQTVAEERRALEAEKEAVRQQAEAVKVIDEGEKRLWAVDERLAQYARINWQQLEAEDPLTAAARFREYTQLKEYRGNLVAKVDEAKAKRSEIEQLDRAKRIQEAEDTARQIKGWTPEVGNKVADLTRTYGFSQDEISDMVARYGGKAVKLAHAAFLGEQLVQQKQAAAKTPTVPQEPVKPLAPVVKSGSSPAPRKSLEAMSMEEYAAARKAGRKV